MRIERPNETIDGEREQYHCVTGAAAARLAVLVHCVCHGGQRQPILCGEFPVGRLEGSTAAPELRYLTKPQVHHSFNVYRNHITV